MTKRTGKPLTKSTRATKFQAKYNLTPAEYNDLLESLRGIKLCTVCDAVLPDDTKRFYGKYYCNRHHVVGRRAVGAAQNPVGRFGAKTGG